MNLVLQGPEPIDYRGDIPCRTRGFSAR